MSTSTNNWFRARRKALKMTIREVAERCNVTQGCIQNWEWNKSAPRSSDAIAVARAYETDLATIAFEIVKLAIRVRRLADRRPLRAAS
jgi:transcriptional regulator with XRE-family HTH domain